VLTSHRSGHSARGGLGADLAFGNDETNFSRLMATNVTRTAPAGADGDEAGARLGGETAIGARDSFTRSRRGRYR
jgi:hypothetical protein